MEQGSVSDWNKPGKYPTIENIAAIAKATNVCVEWLLLERGPKHPGPPDEPLAVELWALWPKLSESAKGRLVGMATEHVEGRALRALPAPEPERQDILQRP